jgi:anti-anti-sigma regulatory factor
MFMLELRSEGGRATLRLDGELAFGSIRELRGRLLEALRGHSRVTLEIVRLEALDLAGLQLVYAAAKSAARTGVDFRFDPGLAAGRIDRLLAFAGLPPLPPPPEAAHGV